MKVAFVWSVHGRQTYDVHYRTIVNLSQQLGHEVVNASLLLTDKKELEALDSDQQMEFHRKMIESMKKADVIIVEASYASFSVGYMLSIAISLSKPVVILFSGQQEPHLLVVLENQSDRIQVIRYSTIENLREEVPQALEFAFETQDTRFNFFISPDHSQYLNWVSRQQRVSRSVYLRNLIFADMEKNGQAFMNSSE